VEGINTYLSSFNEFEKSRAAEKHPWLHDIRRAAIHRFSELGIPTTGMEEWRYTNIAPIVNLPFRPAEYKLNGLTGAVLGKYTFSEVECCRLVFLNGVYSEELSSFTSLPRGCRVKTLSAALAENRELVEHNLARVAKLDQQAFTALNTAFMDEGAFVYLSPGTVLNKVVHLLFISGGQPEPTISHPRSLIVLGAGSQATVVESYLGRGGGRYFTNAVTEVVVGSGSLAEHYMLQREGEEACHVGALEVLQERDSNFTTHSISLGGAMVRNDTNVVMRDEAGECTLNGLYVAKGRQHIDNHTVIDHARPHCTSRELYKGILDDASSGVFSGKIVVRQDAQKTNAKQTNRNLTGTSCFPTTPWSTPNRSWRFSPTT